MIKPAQAQTPAAPSYTAGRYVQEVLSLAPDVAEARESLESLRRQWMAQIGIAALPTVSFSATAYPWGYNPANNFIFNTWRLNRNDMTFNTTFNWNIFNSFKDYENVRFASLAKDSAMHSLNAAQQSRALSAIQAFFDLNLKNEVLEENKQNLAAWQEQYRVTEDLYRHGLKSLADLLKSKTDLRTAELGVISAEADQKTFLMKFNVLLDREPTAPAAVKTDAQANAESLPEVDHDLGKAFGQRPEILRARTDLEKFNVAFIQSIQNNLLPTFAVNATWNRQDQATFGVPNSNLGIRNPNYYVGLSLSLPVGFNLFTQTQNVLAARADRRRLAQNLRDVSRQVRQDVYSGYFSLENAYQTFRVAVEKEDIAQRSLRLVIEQYKQGTADIIRLSQAQLDYLSAQTQRSQAFHDTFVNWALYRLAIGEPLWK